MHLTQALAEHVLFSDEIMVDIAASDEVIRSLKIALRSDIIKEHDFAHVLELGEHLECLFVAHQVTEEEYQMKLLPDLLKSLFEAGNLVWHSHFLKLSNMLCFNLR
jgi:hypothetical protein